MAAALVPMSAVFWGRCLQGGVLGQNEGELSGGDALQLNDRGRRLSIVEDSAREGGREQ